METRKTANKQISTYLLFTHQPHSLETDSLKNEKSHLSLPSWPWLLLAFITFVFLFMQWFAKSNDQSEWPLSPTRCLISWKATDGGLKSANMAEKHSARAWPAAWLCHDIYGNKNQIYNIVRIRELIRQGCATNNHYSSCHRFINLSWLKGELLPLFHQNGLCSGAGACSPPVLGQESCFLGVFL